MLKKKKYKIKPIVYIILILFLLILLILLLPKNYEKKYTIDNYIVNESYDSKTKRYNLSISKDDNLYEYNFNSKYIGKKIISKINDVSSGDYSCIIIDYKNNNSIPLCSGIDYHLVDDIDFSSFKKDFNNNAKTIDNKYLYNTLNRTYLIWNYNNFSYINDSENSRIDLFNSDYYNIDIATIIKDYLVIANYDDTYNFKELIMINLKNKSKDIWKLNYELSFESYVLGTIDNYIYLVDRKNKNEYRLDINKKEMKLVGSENKGGVILNNGNLEDISMYKLISNDLEFDYGNDQKYIIENNRLYLKTKNSKILSSKNDITKIIYQSNDYVYYLVGDTLYYHSINDGEVIIMKNFEWNFNNNNIIFIY